MRNEPYKVIVWGPGTVGKACIKGVLQTPGLQLVGVLAYGEAKCGLDAGELVGQQPTGIIVTNDKEAILALDADVVLHAAQTPFDLGSIDADVVRILESGKNVVSSTSYHFPFRHGREHVELLHSAGKKGNATLLGTGVHPGFVGDILAMTLSGLCTQVESVTVREFIDVSHTADKSGLAGLGYGGEPDEIAARDQPFFTLLERYWGDSLAYMARALFDAEAQIERVTSFIPAETDIVISGLTVNKGQVAEMRHELVATVDGAPRIKVVEHLYYGSAASPQGYVDSADFYEIEIEGQPSSVRMRMALKASLLTGADYLPGDTTGQAWYATATPMVRAIPAVVAGRPGLALPETPRRFAADARLQLPAADMVARELQRLEIAP